MPEYSIHYSGKVIPALSPLRETSALEYRISDDPSQKAKQGKDHRPVKHTCSKQDDLILSGKHTQELVALTLIAEFIFPVHLLFTPNTLYHGGLILQQVFLP